MSIQTQQSTPGSHGHVPAWEDVSLAEEQVYRAGVYNLLARLLQEPPRSEMLEQLALLSGVNRQNDELAFSMSMLGLSAQGSSTQQVDEEYHALFIGLGRGELVPFGSWYLTGFLMEKPLALLRDDLRSLGYERQDGTCEPEDHIAALCEVMAMLIAEKRPTEIQKKFFDSHLSAWAGRFFADLSEAKNAVFYRAVGRFGNAFVELEEKYLSMNV